MIGPLGYLFALCAVALAVAFYRDRHPPKIKVHPRKFRVRYGEAFPVGSLTAQVERYNDSLEVLVWEKTRHPKEEAHAQK